MADKLDMMSMDVTQANIAKIRELFPSVVTEVQNDGKTTLAVDFDLLKEELSSAIMDEKQERYQMTWPDKRKAKMLASSKISATLRPDKAKSVDFDNTQNVYIEGDNLDVLKLLRETYLGKIKVIYIDPPYNTGKNILYKNDFSQSTDEYAKRNGEYDEQGNRLVANTESNGRFHTDWLNIMYPVIKVARDFLCDNGYIVLAIDDNEVYNLKRLCDEIFSENNYIGTIVTRCNPQGRNKDNIDPVHEYHLLYAKSINELPALKIKKDDVSYGNLMRSGTNSRKFERPYRFFPMLVKNGLVSTVTPEEYAKIYNPRDGFNEDYLQELKARYEAMGYIYILPYSQDGEAKVWQRQFSRVSEECSLYKYENGQIKIPGEETRTPISLWTDQKYSNVAYGTNKLKQLFNSDKIPFDFSKSIYTVKDLISLNIDDDDTILDFFSGSATTAHAVMQLNAEDGGHRKFIMVQLPELCDEKSEAYKAGYKTICDIGEERIRRAGKKIKGDRNIKIDVDKSKLIQRTLLDDDTFEDKYALQVTKPNDDNLDKLDVGFRVFKLDSSNMQEVYYNPNAMAQDLLESTVDNIKPDRTPLDLLFQVMLDLGKPLSSKIEEQHIEGKTVYLVNGNDLIACFDDDITNEVITAIAKQQPLYAVFKDKSFANDSVAINNEQLFKTYSPSTTIKVL